MSGVEIIDRSGELPSQNDFKEALDAVSGAMVGRSVEVPPDLMLVMPVIHRCLKAGKALFAEIDRRAEEKGRAGK